MHRIVKSYLDDFIINHGFEQLDESEQFEYFINHLIVSNKSAIEFDLEEVTTSINDSGIDGIAILINEEICTSIEAVESIFENGKKNNDVEIIFTQAKRSEKYDLGDFLKFTKAIENWITSNYDEYLEADTLQMTSKEIFEKILSSAPKIKGGQPRISITYATSGQYKEPKEIERAKATFIKALHEIGYFSDIEIRIFGREDISFLWNRLYTAISAELNMFSQAALPEFGNIEIKEAYLAVVKATDYVDNLLIDTDGNLQTHVFVENVRAFLGIENPVNASIANTLKNQDTSTLFPVLNNGITIVSPDVKIQGNRLFLENYQIINGCQTSNVLYEMKEHINDSMMITLKVIETSNEDIFSELVRATNSQTKVEENQFYSLTPIIKKVEQYFNSYTEDDTKLYLAKKRSSVYWQRYTRY